jgi:hypothetical protein
MDNLGSHKGRAVRALIRSVGAKLLFLPKYSPRSKPDRAGLRQAHLLRSDGARRRRHLGRHPSVTPSFHAKGMRQLFRKRRIRLTKFIPLYLV